MKTSDIVARLTELQERVDAAKAAWLFWRTKAEFQVSFDDDSFYDDQRDYHNIEIIEFLPEELRDKIEKFAFERWKAYDNLIKRIEQGDYSVLNCVSL